MTADIAIVTFAYLACAFYTMSFMLRSVSIVWPAMRFSRQAICAMLLALLWPVSIVVFPLITVYKLKH